MKAMSPAAQDRLTLLNRALLEQMGFTRAHLRKAWKRTVEAMDAKKTQFFSFEGEVCDERTVIDHFTRLEASEKAFKLAGAYPSKAEAQGTGGTLLVEVTTLAPDGTKTVVRLGAKGDESTKLTE